MTIPTTLHSFLAARHATWDVIEHPRTASSAQTVRVAHIPAQRLAKSVVLEDDEGYLMVVLPANCRVHIGELSRYLERRMRLASEQELTRLLSDCEPGAVPATGQAYGVKTLVDDALLAEPDIFFEAGDHTELIHMSGKQFMHLMADAGHGRFMTQERWR